MTQLLNQHSFILIALLALALLTFALRKRSRRMRWSAVGALLGVLGLALVSLRTGSGDAQVPAQGQPTLLEFYSDY